VALHPASEAAISFLRRFPPKGPWALSSFGPGDNEIGPARTFDPSEADAARQFIEALQGKRNVYFSVNGVSRKLKKKAKKSDIDAIRYLHVDADLSKMLNWSYPVAVMAERNRILEQLRRHNPAATAIIWSGGGYQAFWRLSEPIVVSGNPDLMQPIERKMQQIVRLLGADPCHNADRIMRVPGTINVLGKTKVRAGRKPAVAELVEFHDDRTYRLEDFPDLESGRAHGQSARPAAAFGGDEFERARDALRAVPADDYNVYLRIAMALKAAFGNGGFSLYREWAMSSIKFDDADVRKKWQSVKPEGGVTIATLFGMARDHGWLHHRQGSTRSNPWGNQTSKTREATTESGAASLSSGAGAQAGNRPVGANSNERSIDRINIEDFWTKFKEDGGYREVVGGIEYRKRTRDALIWIPLTNFRARIVSDAVRDDGIEAQRALEINAEIKGRCHSFSIPAAQFLHMNWPLEHMGGEAVVEPGQGSRDRARAAIQVLSGSIRKRRIYTHTGWRRVEDRYVYMHGGGALGADGAVDGIEVHLPDALERYRLLAPGDLRDAVCGSLEILKVARTRVAVPLIGAIYSAVLGGADFSLHLSGRTGAQKSELAALAQQHYGAALDARALPCSWSSTGDALEAIASAAKDTVVVIDDYVPQGTIADRSRLNALADRVLRAQGNSCGRARMRPDATLRRARPPRGIIISTGEEVPGGQSLRARLVIVEVQPGAVSLEHLTTAQSAAAQGSYARAMAGYVMWLAPRLDQVREDLRTISHEGRTTLPATIHARTADAIAQLVAAWTVWLRFVVKVGAVTAEEAAAIECEVIESLTALATEQSDLQRASDPVDRFRDLFFAAPASGKAHVASAVVQDGRPPKGPEAWGWRRDDNSVWHSHGDCIGWCDEHGLYLEPEASHAVVQKIGDGIGIAAETLHRRLDERGILLSHEMRGRRRRLKIRKTIGGVRRYVLHVAHDLRPVVGKRDPSGPSGPHDQKDTPKQDNALVHFGPPGTD
jgi:hypothetical protein